LPLNPEDLKVGTRIRRKADQQLLHDRLGTLISHGDYGKPLGVVQPGWRIEWDEPTYEWYNPETDAIEVWTTPFVGVTTEYMINSGLYEVVKDDASDFNG
jgi:hypothetical protein